MKPFRGDEETFLTFTVTPEMSATFGGRTIHEVLSTWTMVHYLEWASRLLLEPHLDLGEEGAGAGVNIRHLAPAPVGATVEVRARFGRTGPGRLVTQVWATSGGRRLAEGEIFQAIWPEGDLKRRMSGAR